MDVDLHPSVKTKDEMESRLRLNAVISHGSLAVKLLSGENEALLIWRNSFLLVDFSFDDVYAIRAPNVEH